MSEPASDHYSPPQKWLHWLTAFFVVSLVTAGLIMTEIGDGQPKNILYELHKSLGLTVLGLTLVRIVVRVRRGAPPFVPGLPRWQRVAAHASHYALYLLIVLVPLLGWTATSVGFPPVNYFWTVPVTLPLPHDETLSERIFGAHKALAFTLVAVAGVHLSAALFHHFIRRDRTLLRMWPGRGAISGRGQPNVAAPQDTRRA